VKSLASAHPEWLDSMDSADRLALERLMSVATSVEESG
jgi:hypothetical protein